VHQDPITKSQRITDSSGNLTSTIVDLDPWGGETGRSSNQAFQPHRYTSYERDANGGDDAMMRRYQPSNSRFHQPDPYDGSYNLTDPQSLNRYAYTQNDPVNFVDPSGLNVAGGNCYWAWGWRDDREGGWELDAVWRCEIENSPGGGGAGFGSGFRRGESTNSGAQPCNVTIPDERSKAIVATALGEGTPFGSAGQYPKTGSGPLLPLSQQEFRNEAFYMASVMVNRFNTGAYGSYHDVANAPNQFLGYQDGLNRIKQLGNNGDEYCERARYVMDALNYIFDQGNGAAPGIMYWRGVNQGGDLRPFRLNDIRAANTDFMVGNPESRGYRQLPRWTTGGWR
jgi:RHS repeat-associated protein